jgi:hypothetical protein
MVCATALSPWQRGERDPKRSRPDALPRTPGRGCLIQAEAAQLDQRRTRPPWKPSAILGRGNEPSASGDASTENVAEVNEGMLCLPKCISWVRWSC